MTIAGLLLAAGEGRRYGMPKALAFHSGRRLVSIGASTLAAAGCSPVLVVIGAAAASVREADPGLTYVNNPDWPSGMGSSLRAGLTKLLNFPDLSVFPPTATPAPAPSASPTPALGGSETSRRVRQNGAAPVDNADAVDAVIVLLVDMPGVSPAAVERVARHAAPDALVMGGYGDRRGHPVLIGREHWAGVASSAIGDRGARDYLRAHEVRVVPVGDVADDYDLDTAHA